MQKCRSEIKSTFFLTHIRRWPNTMGRENRVHSRAELSQRFVCESEVTVNADYLLIERKSNKFLILTIPVSVFAVGLSSRPIRLPSGCSRSRPKPKSCTSSMRFEGETFSFGTFRPFRQSRCRSSTNSSSGSCSDLALWPIFGRDRTSWSIGRTPKSRGSKLATDCR